jgi:hypothetical protein
LGFTPLLGLKTYFTQANYYKVPTLLDNGTTTQCCFFSFYQPEYIANGNGTEAAQLMDEFRQARCSFRLHWNLHASRGWHFCRTIAGVEASIVCDAISVVVEFMVDVAGIEASIG